MKTPQTAESVAVEAPAPRTDPGQDGRHLTCVQQGQLVTAAPWGASRQTMPMPAAFSALAGAGGTLVGLADGQLWRWDGAWAVLQPAPAGVEQLSFRGSEAVLYAADEVWRISQQGQVERLQTAASASLGPRLRGADEPGFPGQGADPALGVVLVIDEESPWGGRLVAEAGGALRWLDARGRDRTPPGMEAFGPEALRGYGPGDMLLLQGETTVLAAPPGLSLLEGVSGPCTWWWGPT